MPPRLPLLQDCTVFETENKILHVVSPAAASPYQIKCTLAKSRITIKLLQRRPRRLCPCFVVIQLRLLLRDLCLLLPPLHLSALFIARRRVIFVSLFLL